MFISKILPASPSQWSPRALPIPREQHVFTIDRSFNYPDGPVLGFKDGSLIKGSPYTVYLIDSGKKRGFTSAAAFLGLGYSFLQVRSVPDGELDLHEQGSLF